MKFGFNFSLISDPLFCCIGSWCSISDYGYFLLLLQLNSPVIELLFSIFVATTFLKPKFPLPLVLN